jgi:dihydrolipoamide dehydrogenase
VAAILRRHHHRFGSWRLRRRDPRGAARSQGGGRGARASGGICNRTGAAFRPRRCCVRPKSMHYAACEGLRAVGRSKVSTCRPDLAAIVALARHRGQRMNTGVGFLFKKNKVDVIWGEAAQRSTGDSPARSRIEDEQEAGRAGRCLFPKNTLGRGHAMQAKHIIVATGARPRALPGHRAGRQADLDLFRGDGRPRRNAEIAAGDGVWRDRHRIRQSFYRTMGVDVTVVEVHAADHAGRRCGNREERAASSSRSRA